MMSILNQYTPEIMAEACSKCGAKALERCRPSSGMPRGSIPTPPHAARKRAAYYRPWCYKCQMGDPHTVHETAEEVYDLNSGDAVRCAAVPNDESVG